MAFYSLKVRFVVQVENRVKGLQTFEERILLVQAETEEEAKAKVSQSFSDYEKPYLNPYGERVRWKFEEFIGIYELNYDSLDVILENLQNGIELYSELKQRRMNLKRAWLNKNA